MRLVVALIAMIQAMLREGSEGPGPGWWFTFFIGKRWEKIRTNMKKGENDYRTWGVFISSFLETACWIQDSGGLCGENRQPAPKTSTIWIALAAIDSIN